MECRAVVKGGNRLAARRALLLAIADDLETGRSVRERDLNFDMRRYVDRRPGCGTVACLAGHAVAIADPACFQMAMACSDDCAIHYRAAALLRLTDAQAFALFQPGALRRIGRLMAAEMCRWLAAQDRVLPRAIERKWWEILAA